MVKRALAIDGKYASHERIVARQNLSPGSVRGFGIVFTIFFLILSIWPVFSGESIRFWSLTTAGLLLCITVILPQAFKPFNALWFRLGLVIGWVVNPMVMFLIFVLSVVPTAIVLKLMRKNTLQLKFDQDEESYWIKREEFESSNETMRRQF